MSLSMIRDTENLNKQNLLNSPQWKAISSHPFVFQTYFSTTIYIFTLA
jgi:hypothetical protein